MRKAYDARYRVMVNGFCEMEMDCFEPYGAFYVFSSIRYTGLSTDEFCTRLLFEGSFGECGEGFVRCSYAYSIDAIKIALERTRRFLDTLPNT